MYLSKLFIPITKDLPTEAKIKSHQLMLRTGMIKQSSAGIYSWLPLGFKVMKKIEQIVREEQNAVGAQEMLMPTIQSSEIWKESGRYDDYGEEMLRIKDRQGREILYGPTNEELITDVFRSSVKSYKSLPQLLYHVHRIARPSKQSPCPLHQGVSSAQYLQCPASYIAHTPANTEYLAHPIIP